MTKFLSRQVATTANDRDCCWCNRRVYWNLHEWRHWTTDHRKCYPQ